MITVIIAAHDEEQVLGACLEALAAQSVPGAVQVVVSANGCSDGTADIARSRGVEVVERAEAGKPGALNAAEIVAEGTTRVYLDADIIVPPDGLALLLDALDAGALAAVPRRSLRSQDSALLVRAYCAISERLPVFREGLFGRGMIALSAAGRARFDRFPELIADDLFLDAQFAPGETQAVPSVCVTVQAPRTTRALFDRLVRVRRGNSEMRAAAARGSIAAEVRPSDPWAWLRHVVLPRPWLAPAAIAYVAITIAATIAASSAREVQWGRDDTTRASGEDIVPTRSAPDVARSLLTASSPSHRARRQEP